MSPRVSPPLPCRVSIVIPFRDAERFLAETIDSLIRQTYREWELLLVDDGSADAGAAYAQHLATKHPARIHYLTTTGSGRTGPGAARNIGIAAARGEFVAMHDADDISEADRIREQVAYLDAHPDVALLGSQYSVIDDAGRRLGTMTVPGEWLDIRWALLFFNPFPQSGVMLRKDVVIGTVGYYNEAVRYVEDYEYWCRIVPRLPVANLKRSLVRYRVHDDSISRSGGEARRTFQRIRLETVNAMLRSGAGGGEVDESRRAAMTALYLGWELELDVAGIDQALEDVLRLQDSFCHATGLTEASARRHSARLRARLARNLVALAASLRTTNGPDAVTLLHRARQLSPAALLRPVTMLRCGLILARHA